MRLIDADALMEYAKNRYMCTLIPGDIMDQPTVDAVVLPCKMGDVVWGVKTFNRGLEARQGEVNQMYFGEDMRICICVKNICRGEWGKNVFATKEEAEAEIERRKNES